MRMFIRRRNIFLEMRMRMRITPTSQLVLPPMKHSVTAAKKNSTQNRVATNCTIDPQLKAWGIEYAKDGQDKSLSELVNRLLRQARAKEMDRQRKAAA